MLDTRDPSLRLQNGSALDDAGVTELIDVEERHCHYDFVLDIFLRHARLIALKKETPP